MPRRRLRRKPDGTRRSVDAYPLALDTLGDAEIEAAIAVLRSGRYTMGALVRQFETEFAQWVGADAAVMVNSGSSANLLMIEALMRGPSRSGPRWVPGDEVIVPALSWPTTVWPVAQLGLIPVVVDVDPVTLAVDADSAAAAVSSRTRGIFVTHVLGQTADMDALGRVAHDRSLTLLEDACESLGSAFGGRHVGSIGLMGSFSLYFSHHMTTIEGGVVVTGDAALADDLRSMRAHGWSRERTDSGHWSDANPGIDPRFLFVTTGFNLRPTEIQAAIGSVQLRRLPGMLHRRGEVARRVADQVASSAPWLEMLGTDGEVMPVDHPKAWSRNSWMNLAFIVSESAPMSRDEVVDRLERQGVETRPIIAGNLARHPAMATIDHRIAGPLPVADRAFARGFMIGCSSAMEDEHIDIVLSAFASL